MADESFIKIDTKEIDALASKLQAIGGMAKMKAQNAITAVAYKIDRAAKHAVPVDTGRLKNSIHVVLKETDDSFSYSDDQGRTYSGSLGDVGFEKGVIGAAVGTNVEYAAEMELNHPTRHHYLTNAVETHRDELIRRLMRILDGVGK